MKSLHHITFKKMKKLFILIFRLVQCIRTAYFNVTDFTMDCDGSELEEYLKDAQTYEEGFWKE